MIEIKKSVKDLIPYKPNDYDCKIKLDANESKNYLFPTDITLSKIPLNLYPDTQSKKLREALSRYVGMDPNHIIAGNGSSEIIELILKTFIEKGDYVLSFEPSFSMYQIYSTIYDATYISVDDYDTYQMNLEKCLEKIKIYQPKIIFLCSPNNPTGQIIPKENIIKIIENANGLVVLDEAYIEFSEKQTSMAQEVIQYQNLIVLRTMSKAFGLAGMRLGYAISNQQIINQLYQIKSPYNLNALSQSIGVIALNQIDQVQAYKNQIKELRNQLYEAMQLLDLKVYPSDANFLFFESNIPNLFEKLISKDVLIRAFKGKLQNRYRVTIGNQDENDAFIQAIKEIIYENRNT